MNILITGVAGFIGSNLADWILDNTNHAVIGVDNLSGGFLENVNDRVKFYKLDITDGSLDTIFKDNKIDLVYHLAAYASEGRSNYIRKFINQNNTLGTLNIINLCVNYKAKLIFTSSVAIYSGTPPFTEELLPSPIDEYGLSKFSSELSIKIAGEVQGLDWVIIRPRNVYGPKQNLFDPTRNLMGILCYKLFNKQDIEIFGDGNNKRSFTYIDDILEPLYNARNVSKQSINLGSEKVYTINEAVDTLLDIVHSDSLTSFLFKDTKVIHTEPRHEVGEAFCSIDKSIKFLDFKDKTNLYEGLSKMWKWANNQDMKQLLTPPELEVFTNLHSSIK